MTGTNASAQAWQELLEAGQFERHFNQLQATYRALASTWLLASFAGIGFTIVNGKMIPIDWLVVATGIAAMGAVGIGLIWNLDLLVYHRLLDVVFLTARRIEQIHEELPPFRVHMLRLFRQGGVVNHVIWYYAVGIDLLIAIGTVAASLESAQHRWPWPLTALGGLLIGVVTTYAILRVTHSYQKKMQLFFHIHKGMGTGMLSWSPGTSTWTEPSPPAS